jgi:SAM-dependent methyltransferase
MVSDRLLTLVCCPDCRRAFVHRADELECTGCGRRFGGPKGAYLDLRPAHAFAETTRYVEAALHADARQERVAPPLLAAGVRNDLLRAVLRPGPEDVVLDLGCGSGRMVIWNRDLGAATIGVDVSPYFAREARETVDLVLGDLRSLPFPDETFTKAYALDVLEHLSPDALRGMLAEAARVLAPGGTLFVYSHVRKNSWLALGLRAINRVARGLEALGLIDMTQERLRKSDHLNPLADIPELERVVQVAGFRVASIRYYTPLIGGVVENIFVRMGEHALARRAARRRTSTTVGLPQDQASAVREARAATQTRLARGGPLLKGLQLVTAVMKLDLLLFGRIRSGPFFALLRKDAGEDRGLAHARG